MLESLSCHCDHVVVRIALMTPTSSARCFPGRSIADADRRRTTKNKDRKRSSWRIRSIPLRQAASIPIPRSSPTTFHRLSIFRWCRLLSSSHKPYHPSTFTDEPVRLEPEFASDESQGRGPFLLLDELVHIVTPALRVLRGSVQRVSRET